MQRNHKKHIILYLLLILLFLCAVPAVSYAAQQQNALPEPTGDVDVPAGTTVDSLGDRLDVKGSGLTLTVLKTDGSTRYSGLVETGDLAVLNDSTGEIFDCERIVVAGSESSESPQPSSSESEISSDSSSSSVQSSSATDSEASSDEPISSTPSVPDSEASSSQPASNVSSGSSSKIPQGGTQIFAKPVTVDSLQNALDSQSDVYASNVQITSAAGIKRESGYVCTGDTITVFDKSGNTTSTVTAIVLGDLTRCGKPTKSGMQSAVQLSDQQFRFELRPARSGGYESGWQSRYGRPPCHEERTGESFLIDRNAKKKYNKSKHGIDFMKNIKGESANYV